ncbi:uncharacterized protein YbjT (DUF2867 family) [Saccharopolyspora lacisalsi]|uniref:Uncharacterized protein YbjT (DUF2867 family) n=1 Tax=Halosaccharopolyspora lacisalsi TaxID=1000566 RepID=A0A839E431_9PSEU|nr:SDR family oxidoreductase [Halosaccharopolyspora lacisalsi]MBA8827619.1 uncharacterized protein YbjT (DUF2867 family) [Halosaccharopolyspora lacisalsi]
MRIVVAGAHGKIAQQLGRLLVARGDSVLGLVRAPEQAEDLRAAGVEPLVADLEEVDAAVLAGHLSDVNAAVFAAGAGPGSGSPRKDSVDRAASALLADACERAGVRRFLQVSAIGLDRANPEGISEVFAAYLDAKRAAERELRSRSLDWTVLRPGRLTDEPATGHVTLGESLERADVTRGDVAAVLVALLHEPASIHRTLELVNGPTPVAEAVRSR